MKIQFKYIKRYYEVCKNFMLNLNNKRNPKFISYKDFKLELSGCFSNKLVSSPNKFRAFLIFLNFLYQFIKIGFFPFHASLKSNLHLKIFP